jgi:hypothetical protein
MDEKDDKKDDKKFDENKLTDIFKKVVNTGISAAFMTEDAVKSIIGDLPLPKEIVNGLLQNAKSTKDEFISSVKSELKEYLNKVDLTHEIDRIIEKYDIEVNAKIKLTPKKQDEPTKE